MVLCHRVWFNQLLGWYWKVVSSKVWRWQYPWLSGNGYFLPKNKGRGEGEGLQPEVSYLNNMIPTNVIPTEKLLVPYYIKGFPKPIAMWVKMAHKNTQQESFS